MKVQVMVVAIMLALFPLQVQACECPPGEESVAEAYAMADIVFIGKVAQLAADYYETGMHATLFQPGHVIKGSAPGTVVAIATVDSANTCDITFWEGKEYLVYATFDQYHIYRASMCDRTTFASGAEDEIAQLEKIASDPLQHLPPGFGQLTPFPKR